MATRTKSSQGGRSRTKGGGSAGGARGRARGTAGARRAGAAGARRGAGSRGRARGGAGARAGAATRQQDAIGLLRSEHDQVNQLFEEFERAAHARGGGTQRKTGLAIEICRQLQIHTALEEEIFYPAAADAIRDQELIPEATVEHQSAKDLIAKIERMDPQDELYDATVMVLGEYVRHHVREEQTELFPQVKRSGLDLRALGEQLRERRSQLSA